MIDAGRLMKAKITLPAWRCERCGHTWVPRRDTVDIRICPKCKSPYWDRPTKR